MPFQKQVNNQPAPAVEGDFCSANPRASVLVGPNGFLAPVGGLTVSRFCWADPNTGDVSQSYKAGYQLGYLHRENQALITTFLGDNTLVVPAGLVVTLLSQGEFWARFDAGATPGNAVYADPNTGKAVAGAAGGLNVSSVTASAGSAFTGAIASNVLTISALTGYVSPGDVLAGAGVTPGTVIGAQLTGTPGAAGTYTVTHANVASEAMTATSSVLDVTAVASGALGVGSKLSGSGVSAGTVITGLLTGTGGVGRYTISPVQHFAPTTVSENAIATPYKVHSLAANGELAKISSWG
jgi:hypothetical protein